MGKSDGGIGGFLGRLFGRKPDSGKTDSGKGDSGKQDFGKQGLKEQPADICGADGTSEAEVDPEQVKRVLELFKEKTNRDVITIELVDCDVDIAKSKFGGVPYIPRGQEAPENTKGQQLRLLAQIRMEELPKSGIGFPKKGMLQFWALDDDCTGLDFNYSFAADDYRITYHAEIDETVTKDEVAEKYHPYVEGESYFPIQDEFGLRFTLEKEAMTYSDYQFEKTLVDLWNQEYPEDLITNLERLDEESIADQFSNGGHKMGGYPFFTQWDPRENKLEQYQILLLQIDSFGLENKQIMWGDSGVANFFIPKDALKKLDFSSVLYNWDCY